MIKRVYQADSQPASQTSLAIQNRWTDRHPRPAPSVPVSLPIPSLHTLSRPLHIPAYYAHPRTTTPHPIPIPIPQTPISILVLDPRRQTSHSVSGFVKTSREHHHPTSRGTRVSVRQPRTSLPVKGLENQVWGKTQGGGRGEFQV